MDRKTFLHSFRVEMKLNKGFFLKILGYDISTSGFADDAIARLEFLGCSKAREYYDMIREEWQQEHDRQMKNVAVWYRKQSEKEYEDRVRKAVSESRKQQEAEQLRVDLQQMSDRELLTLLQKLRQTDT